ncbi:SMI1/KNR4 family protein [Collimonas fungivorans]|uniref:SMI1/KNR4 family protein n=1 Tax=Collimonas fungivorans TaxID=158899 RepID=UPI0005A2B98C|nr:SMI1/KNR4 family protein [Collimonas fungivorans]
MTIKELTAMLQPPEFPIEAPPPGGWLEVERRLKTALPQDYKDYVEIFGSGTVSNFLWILNPFSANPNLNLEQQLKTQTDVLKDLRNYGEDVPYRCFPQAGGIFPFALSDNGDVLHWLTNGLPAERTVVVNEARGPEWQHFDLSMADFVTGVLAKKFSCQIFPSNFPEQFPNFSPRR